MTIAGERAECRKMWEQYDKEDGVVGRLYEERDLEVERLWDEFYEMCGLNVDVDDVKVEWGGEEGDWELKMKGGWFIARDGDDEGEIVFKDLKEVGRLSISCRGSLYMASMNVGGKEWQADEQTNCWREV